MISVQVNRVKYLIKKQLSVFDGCKFLGLVIPRFCYHELLSVAGNCRMCLVELRTGPFALKPMVSCAIPFLPRLSVFLNTPMVQKARSNVMEMLLVYHPLDCPVCDQAGECDLQDQTKLYGVKFSRHFFHKRGVENKNTGAVVKTIMSRCIHCTRCVRFNKQVMGGKEVLGTINRGVHTEISFYDESLFNSELSANIVDLCPVGALTLKPYTFKTRPWELKVTSTIDLTDSFGSNIYIQHKNLEIFRVLPRANKDLNETLISNRARFFADALYTNRLTHAFKENKYYSLNDSLLDIIKSFKENTKIIIICNAINSFEELYLLKLLTYKFPNISVQNFEVNPLKTNIYSNLNQPISKVINLASVYFLFSINLQVEAALLNYRLRKRLNQSNIKSYAFSLFLNTNSFSNFINLSNLNAALLFKGKNKFLSTVLILSPAISLIFGEMFYSRGFNSFELISLLKKINSNCFILNVGAKANSEGSFLSNIKTVNKQNLLRAKTVLHIHSEVTLKVAKSFISNASIVWLHTHYSKLAAKANYLIPISSNYNTTGTFLNCEGRPQVNKNVFSSTQHVPTLFALGNLFLGIDETFFQSKIIKFFEKFNKVIDNFDVVFDGFSFIKNLNRLPINNVHVSMYPIKSAGYDHYLYNKTLGINSKVLLNCSLELRKKSNQIF